MDRKILLKENPNRYDLTPAKIKKLKILDWQKLKKKTWLNEAKKDTGTWYCHLEGCNPEGQRYDDEDEFWIGFREEDNKIDFSFSSYGGMCGYKFSKFYQAKDMENNFDLYVQVNAIKWLNKMIDNGILGI